MSERDKRRKRPLKQQIRDTRRLLSKEDLPETVRQTKERVLDMLEGEMKEKEKTKKERKISKKYKMVKFFEKRKLVRKIKSLCNELKMTDSEEEKEKILTELQILRGNFNYITYYPIGEKYISLYPSTESSQFAIQTRDAIRQDIVSQIDNGTLSDAFVDAIDPSIVSLISGCGPSHFCSTTNITAADNSIDEESSNDQLNSSSQLLLSPVKKSKKGTKRNHKNEKLVEQVQESNSDDGEELIALKRKKQRTKAPCDDESEEELLLASKIKSDPFFM